MRRFLAAPDRDTRKSAWLAISHEVSRTADTMEDIFEAARRGGTKLVMFCETGANLCQEYVKLGVDSAIAEYFPFYIFGGQTRIDIYRRK